MGAPRNWQSERTLLKAKHPPVTNNFPVTSNAKRGEQAYLNKIQMNIFKKFQINIEIYMLL